MVNSGNSEGIIFWIAIVLKKGKEE